METAAELALAEAQTSIEKAISSLSDIVISEVDGTDELGIIDTCEKVLNELLNIRKELRG